MVNQISRGVAAAVAAFVLAAPASAGTLYAWRTDAGTYAFADDLKRVPARYRDRVQARESRSMDDYERFTPQSAEVTNAYEHDLEQSLIRLRRLNRELDAEAAPRFAAAEPVRVRINGQGMPLIDVPAEPDGDQQPVVVEKRRMLANDGAVTRYNTVIRQGNRTLAIIRPESGGTHSLLFEDESSLED